MPSQGLSQGHCGCFLLILHAWHDLLNIETLHPIDACRCMPITSLVGTRTFFTLPFFLSLHIAIRQLRERGNVGRSFGVLRASLADEAVSWHLWLHYRLPNHPLTEPLTDSQTLHTGGPVYHVVQSETNRRHKGRNVPSLFLAPSSGATCSVFAHPSLGSSPSKSERTRGQILSRGLWTLLRYVGLQVILAKT